MVSNKYNKYGVNKEAEKMFYVKKEKANMDKRMKVIRAFTSTDYLYQFFYLLKGYSIKTIDNNKMKLCYKNESIEFKKLSDCLIGEDEESVRIRKELLNYRKRKGQCHFNSLQLLPSIGGNIVTGYVDDQGDTHKIIHSWIEDENNVIDYTSNLVIKKEDYNRLMNVEIVSVISKDDVLADSNSEFFQKYLGCKFYCLFRDELVREGLIKPAKEKVYKK